PPRIETTLRRFTISMAVVVVACIGALVVPATLQATLQGALLTLLALDVFAGLAAAALARWTRGSGGGRWRRDDALAADRIRRGGAGDRGRVHHRSGDQLRPAHGAARWAGASWRRAQRRRRLARPC